MRELENGQSLTGGRRPEEIVIRRMTPEDIENVLDVERACFSGPW